MAMDIYILRHGLAVELDDPDCRRDAERQLTGEGKRKLEHVADALQAMEISFDLILTSPYKRALQTAEIIAEAFGLKKKIQCTGCLEPGASPRELIEFINGLKSSPENLLLVGHEPDLSRLTSLLVGGDFNVAITLKKGGFVRVKCEQLEHGQCGSLEWLLTPAHMLLMA
jgi:phosphohistidine phosphatase